jgi:hypothetical protein
MHAHGDMQYELTPSPKQRAAPLEEGWASRTPACLLCEASKDVCPTTKGKAMCRATNGAVEGPRAPTNTHTLYSVRRASYACP